MMKEWEEIANAEEKETPENNQFLNNKPAGEETFFLLHEIQVDFETKLWPDQERGREVGVGEDRQE